MLHHDPAHTGYISARAPDSGDLAWTFKVGVYIYSAPTIKDNMVFIGSSAYNEFYALDMKGNGDGTARLIWTFSNDSGMHTPTIITTAAVVNGIVYISVYELWGGHPSTLYALDQFGNGDGTTNVIWKYSFEGFVMSVTVKDGMVFVGSYDGYAYALDAIGNGDGTTNVIWKYSIPGIGTTPAVANGKVFIATFESPFDSPALYALDEFGNGDGTTDLVWKYRLPERVTGIDPAISNGKVFIGTTNKVYAFDETGNGDGTTDLIWSYTTDDVVECSPAVAYGRVFIGGRDNKVYALDESGNGDGTTDLIWSYTTGDWIGGSSPAVADGKVFIGSWDNRIYALDAIGNGDGTTNVIWSYRTGDKILSSPAVAGGMVFIGSKNGKLYAFGSKEAVSRPILQKAILNGTSHENVEITWYASGDDGQPDGTKRYRVFRSTDLFGIYSKIDEVVAKGQPTYTYTDLKSGEGDPYDYFYYIEAVDKTGNCVSSSYAGKFVRYLDEGWQFVSVPLIQYDTTLTTVLQTLEFDHVRYYDRGEWKSYWAFKPYKGNLKEISHIAGVWINVTKSSNFTVAGIVPVETMIHLHAGWNLVGFPSFDSTYAVSDLEAEVKSTRVEGFDPSAHPYYLRVLEDTDIFQPGFGYWVRVTMDVVWTIKNQ